MSNKTAVIIAGGLNSRIKMIKPLINLGGSKFSSEFTCFKRSFSEIILVINKIKIQRFQIRIVRMHVRRYLSNKGLYQEYILELIHQLITKYL